MDRILRICVWGLVSAFSMLANGQTFTIQEINPTHSNTGGNASAGGRVNHVARATDSIYYAASEFGGLFKSTDAGHTWVRLDAHLPTKLVDVAASPTDPNTVIATSLFDGRVNSLAGINVSTDGGANWRHPASATPPTNNCFFTGSFGEPSAFGVAFDPEDSAHVFAGTNCGLAASTDGGQTWKFINPGPGSQPGFVVGVIVHHRGIIDTCGTSGHRRSIDGGVTWTGPQAGAQPLPGAVNCSLAASPEESYVLLATAGTRVFESDNGGGAWNTEFANPSRQGRITFVKTNSRHGNFDLWFGDVGLFRGSCTTPATPAPGGAARCPASTAWTAAGAGAHSDMGTVAFSTPAANSLQVCRQGCATDRDSCFADCADLQNDCLHETPHGTAHCSQLLATCRARCTHTFNTCNANCVNALDSCPAVMSSDGGAYINTLTQSPACQTPAWTQPDVTTRGLWLWSLSGGNVPNSRNKEDLYMGAQDDGSFGTLDGGSNNPTWNNPDCCDVFDTVGDSARSVTTICCFGGRANRIFIHQPGMTGGTEIPNYPAGNVPTFLFPDVIARFGSNRYALATTSGVFITQNITANPITWTPLGTNAPTDACGLWAAGPQSSPTFFAQLGDCNNSFGSSIQRYVGTSTSGTWQNLILPEGFLRVGIFTVDPNNANRLFISAFHATTGLHMLRSINGGADWLPPDAVLDGLMTGNGSFRMQTSLYFQPSLVAFDTGSSKTLLAGAADAGIFLSQDGGTSWSTVTNNAGDAANPVIPRPHWAYFDHECGRFNIFVGTQGRGAWRLSYPDPKAITVQQCQAKCDAPVTDCLQTCADDREVCMGSVSTHGGPTAAQCAQRFNSCRASCNNTRNECRQRCVDCPQ